LGAAATEIGRYYGLPVEVSGLGTDHHIPGIQVNYERAMNGLLPVLAWPDILVGPGMLGGSMTLCFEQMVIDAEIFRMARRAARGINTDKSRWLEDVVATVGPGGQFLSERSTVAGIREGEWYVSRFGMHDTFEGWEVAGRPRLLDEARERVEHILASHQPLPLPEAAEQELDRIQKRVIESKGNSA
jgi:trimethylamine--corrinoid protein Co-methyltransferase